MSIQHGRVVVVSEVVDRNSHEGIFFTNFVKNIHVAVAVIAFAAVIYVVFLRCLNFSLYFYCYSFSWVSGEVLSLQVTIACLHINSLKCLAKLIMHFIALVLYSACFTHSVSIQMVSACVLVFSNCIWLAKGGSMYRRVPSVSYEPIWSN